MLVTVVGAGALGRIYGVRLACGTTEVELVVREARAAETSPFVLEQQNGSRRRDTLAHPRRVTRASPGTSLVLLAVRLEEAEEAARALADLPARAPVVSLTPLLPLTKRRVEDVLGRAVVAGMPGVAGYVDERDVVRYFIPRVASTLFDAPAASGEPSPVVELARRLDEAGLPTRLERGVASQNAATTVAFFPLIAALGAAGSVAGVLDDKALLEAMLAATRECDALAHALGKPAAWTSMLTRFVGPYTLKPGVAMARKLFPEAVRFVEAHFGPKLGAQHAYMGREILGLAASRGLPTPALERLLAARR